jgi:hypothetical protein
MKREGRGFLPAAVVPLLFASVAFIVAPAVGSQVDLPNPPMDGRAFFYTTAG